MTPIRPACSGHHVSCTERCATSVFTLGTKQNVSVIRCTLTAKRSELSPSAAGDAGESCIAKCPLFMTCRGLTKRREIWCDGAADGGSLCMRACMRLRLRACASVAVACVLRV